LDLGALWQQHPDGNLQSPPSWVHDTDRPISPLRAAKDLQGSTTKRVKGVEDLNIRITRAQGIVGVGATILTFIVWSPAADCPMTAPPGIPPARPSSSPNRRSPPAPAPASATPSPGSARTPTLRPMSGRSPGSLTSRHGARDSTPPSTISPATPSASPSP